MSEASDLIERMEKETGQRIDERGFKMKNNFSSTLTEVGQLCLPIFEETRL